MIDRITDRLLLTAIALVVSCCANAADEEADSLFAPPHGINFGHLKILPAFNYDLTYTDNARRTGNEEDDFINEFFPSAAFHFKPDEMITLDGFYEFGWHDYLENEVKDYLSHRTYGEARFHNAFVDNLDFIVGDSYLQSGNANPLQNEFLFFSRYQTNDAYAKAQYAFNRFLISGKIDYGFVDYFARANEGSDYKTYGGEIQGEYQFLPDRLTIFGTYNLTRTLRDATDIDDFDNHTLRLGVKGSYSKLTYSAAVGYNVADFLHRDEQDDGPSVQASLTYTPHQRISVGVYASRGFAAGVQEGISTETLAGGTVSIQLLRRAKFLAGYGFADSDRVRNPDTRTTTAHGTFEWRFTRFAAAEAAYTHTERDESSGPGGYVENAVRLGFRFRW